MAAQDSACLQITSSDLLICFGSEAFLSNLAGRCDLQKALPSLKKEGFNFVGFKWFFVAVLCAGDQEAP